MYWTELVEEITVENVTEKINAKKKKWKSKVIGLSQCHLGEQKEQY